MLYRVLTSLKLGRKRIRVGTVSKLEGLADSTKSRLLELGRVSAVKAPPVIIIPGWKDRAEILKEKFQIVFLDELLCADLTKIAEELDVSVEAIQGLMSYLEI